MVHDILFKVKEEAPFKDEYITENLMLNKAFARFAGNAKDIKYFTDILTQPLLNIENIIYRREILNDFLAVPTLLKNMEDIFKKITALRYENQKSRSRLAFTNPVIELQVNAENLEKVLSLMRTLSNETDCISANSDIILTIINRINEIGKSKAAADIIELCDLIGEIRDTSEIMIHVTVNDNGKICMSDIVDIFNPENDKHKKNKQKKDDTAWYGLKGHAENMAPEIYSSTVKTLTSVFKEIEKNLFDEFGLAAEQISFYRTAVEFINFISSNGIQYSYADIAAEYNMSVKCLRDAVLCVLGSAVVPNSVDIGGILITGANNSGKTVFLRSIGTAQLMTQAGLPILAENAKMSLKNGIYTLFASSENLPAANNAGRFEQEVKRLALIMDNLQSGALILFNELFQTTEYSEGAAALYEILCAFMRGKIDWIAVTHLLELKDDFAQNKNVLKVHVSEQHIAEMAVV